MKKYWALSIYSFISRLFIYFPIVLGLVLFFNNFSIGILFLFGGFIISYLFYFCIFSWYLGYMKFDIEYIYVPNDLVPTITRLQYKEKIYYQKICAIEFKDRDGDSIGKPLWKANSISYLEITTNDNCAHRIAIGKYSHKQWIMIEKEIEKRVPDVLILKSANELIRFRKN